MSQWNSTVSASQLTGAYKINCNRHFYYVFITGCNWILTLGHKWEEELIATWDVTRIRQSMHLHDPTCKWKQETRSVIYQLKIKDSSTCDIKR